MTKTLEEIHGDGLAAWKRYSLRKKAAEEKLRSNGELHVTEEDDNEKCFSGKW